MTVYKNNSKLQPQEKTWDPQAVLEEALRERDRLLSTNPELHELQNEIDSLLSPEDRFEDRMNILGKLIGQRLNILHDECQKLEELCHSVGIQTELPITRFKRSLDVKKLKERLGQ